MKSGIPDDKDISVDIAKDESKAGSHGNSTGYNHFSVKQENCDQSTDKRADEKPEYNTGK